MDKNDEKAYFVWERYLGRYRAARYPHGIPTRDGHVQEFAFKRELTKEECEMPIVSLIDRYPCPPEPR